MDKQPANPASWTWMCPVCRHKMTDEESKGYQGCPTGLHVAKHIHISEYVATLRKGIAVSQSGWGGVLRGGEIVDRREHPEAVPIAKNRMFGVPEPNK